MIHTLTAIICSQFLSPTVALEVAKTSKNVWRNEEAYGDTYVSSTWTVDAFVAEVIAADPDPDPEMSRRAHIAAIMAENEANAR
jgi:hypothetical protein